MNIIIHDKSPKTYIVMGMHKGGTSFLSMALRKMGIDMGDIDNHHYEDKAFWNFNKKILKIAGGSEVDPPSQEAIEKAVQENEEELKKLIKNKPFWGFKDPQSALTLKPMLPYFKDDTYLVCVFRKPDKVAESISSRVTKLNKEECLKLAHHYYKNILETVKTFIST